MTSPRLAVPLLLLAACTGGPSSKTTDDLTTQTSVPQDPSGLLVKDTATVSHGATTEARLALEGAALRARLAVGRESAPYHADVANAAAEPPAVARPARI